MEIGIIGSGAMGIGIAQIAATAGHLVRIYDHQVAAREKAALQWAQTLQMLVEKGKLAPRDAQAIQGRLHFVTQLHDLAPAGLVIEAVVENLDAKRNLLTELEGIVAPQAILATNTSSLPVTAIAAACRQQPGRVVGLHFFNPAPVMKLVEVVPALQTAAEVVDQATHLMQSWGKTVVLAQDTPGFIVNRIARPFYGEALRLAEERIADYATIDWAMTQLGGFRMGPFTLMDFIGHDVNYTVTETIWRAFFFDPRYRPAFAQQRLVDAGYLGKKAGRGFYDYRPGAVPPSPVQDEALGQEILHRILAMLINEAADALYLGIAERSDLETAMLLGANYPKGLLAWMEELGAEYWEQRLDALYALYHEDRYRCSRGLRQLARGQE